MGKTVNVIWVWVMNAIRKSRFLAIGHDTHRSARLLVPWVLVVCHEKLQEDSQAAPVPDRLARTQEVAVLIALPPRDSRGSQSSAWTRALQRFEPGGMVRDTVAKSRKAEAWTTAAFQLGHKGAEKSLDTIKGSG